MQVTNDPFTAIRSNQDVLTSVFTITNLIPCSADTRDFPHGQKHSDNQSPIGIEQAEGIPTRFISVSSGC
jgi:hypothetical protein